MKKPILLLTFIGFLISCSNDENDNSETTELIGQWKLTEQLVDPGDGSGIFQDIDSQKILEFFQNGTINSLNGSLCEPYSDEQISTGTYSLSENRIITNCQNENIGYIDFEIKNNNLILNFISNEGFSQKFEKIK